jgi:hypothetical protein
MTQGEKVDLVHEDFRKGWGGARRKQMRKSRLIGIGTCPPAVAMSREIVIVGRLRCLAIDRCEE